MTGLVCARSGSHWNGKMLQRKEKDTISIFERETSSFPLGYGIGNLSTGKYKHLRNHVLGFFYHSCSQGKSSLQILDIALDYQRTRNSLGALLSARTSSSPFQSKFPSNQGEIK